MTIIAEILAQAFGGDLEPYARKHWSGKEDLRIGIRDITETAQALLGHRLYDRMRRLLSRRGVKLESGSRRFDDED